MLPEIYGISGSCCRELYVPRGTGATLFLLLPDVAGLLEVAGRITESLKSHEQHKPAQL